MKIDYFKIIHKYIPSDSEAYKIYIPHVVLVTAKALKIAHDLKLDPLQIQFIEEVAMLHDIGIINTNDPTNGCFGKLHYMCHGIEGKRILEEEGLPKHAQAVERHFGVGITIEDIEKRNLPLPKKEYIALTIEEKIVSFADMFFSKRNGESVWTERTIEEARNSVVKINEKKGEIFDDWKIQFIGDN